MSEEQQHVAVTANQAVSVLAHTLVDLLGDKRSLAQVAGSLAARISQARDVSLYFLAFFSMRRGYDLCGRGS